jgi:hypothetical protein
MVMDNIGHVGRMEVVGFRVEIGKTKRAASHQHFMECTKDFPRIGNVVHGHANSDQVITDFVRIGFVRPPGQMDSKERRRTVEAVIWCIR